MGWKVGVGWLSAEAIRYSYVEAIVYASWSY